MTVVASKPDEINSNILKASSITSALSKKINNYKVNLEGVEFNNLDYDQYMILTKYMDDVE